MSGSSRRERIGHGERAVLLAALALAILLAWNAGEPWIAREPDFTRRFPGTDYVQGKIALAAALALAVACLRGVFPLLSRNTTIVTGALASALLVAMPVSLWVSLVGERDPNVLHPINSRLLYPDATFMGTAELWSSILLGGAALAIFTYLALSLRRQRDEEGDDSALMYPVVFAALAVIGPFAMWSAGTSWTRLGVEHSAGIVALAASFIGLLAAVMLWRGSASPVTATNWGLITGAAMLAVPVWFYVTSIGEPDATYEQTLIHCSGPCDWVDAGAGLLLSITAGAAYVVSLMFIAARKRRPIVPFDTSPLAPV
jgi:hypothetical protein